MREWFNISRFLALVAKELHQLKRNRRLVAMLVVPPTVNLLLFGVAMNPEVTGLRLGVVDDSRTAESASICCSITRSAVRVASARATIASRCPCRRVMSSGSLSEIVTTSCPATTASPSCTAHDTMRPPTGASIACWRSSGA